jgi:hypothetical protein
MSLVGRSYGDRVTVTVHLIIEELRSYGDSALNYR